MIKKIVILFLLFCLTSCATLFTKKTYEMEFKSAPNTKVKVDDSLYNLPAVIEIKRSKKDLPIVLFSDSLQKKYLLKASISPKYIYGNLAFVHFAPLGYLVDLSTEKRFYYGKTIVLDINDSITQIKTPISKSFTHLKNNISAYFKREHPTHKGQLNLTLSIPWINHFNYLPVGEGRKINAGFLGLSTGIEYYHSKTKFISLTASGVMDFIAPIPAPYSYEGEKEIFTSLSITVTENHKFNRFTLGYGLNFSKNTWKFDSTEYDENNPNSKKTTTKSNYSHGFIVNSYFRVGENFYMGLLYKPSLFTIKPVSQFQYEHVLSLDLAWKIKLK